MRADILLIETGHASTRSQAQRLIAAGVRWRLNALSPWKVVAKNGDEIPEGAEIELADGGQEAKFVSRGGLKLEGALAATGVDVRGLRCLDVGQSTGGFSDCLIQHGAALVVGVDVGHGQLHERLRGHERIVSVEGINARTLTAATLAAACEEAASIRVEAEPEDNLTQPQAPYAWMRNGGIIDEDYEETEGSADATEAQIEAFKAERAQRERARAEGTLETVAQRLPQYEGIDFSERFDVLVADLSFISLTLVLPAVAPLVKPRGTLLVLVKPQFELQPGQVGKGGIVRDAALFELVRQRVQSCARELGLELLGWLESPIEGGDGNREFFLHARQSEHPLPSTIDEQQAQAALAAPRRTSRTTLREQKRADVINGDEEDYYNVPGPARPKRKKKT